MKIKVILYLFTAFIIIISNSCIILDRSQVTPEVTTSADNNKQDINDKVSAAGTSGDEESNKEDNLQDQIIAFDPMPDQLIASPLIIAGEARGTWFFEGTFSVSLLDSNGNVLALHYGTTDKEWMTEDFIPFTARIEFDDPETATGSLILEKNNPSDIREYDAQLIIPVRFE